MAKESKKEKQKFNAGAYGWIITKDHHPDLDEPEGSNCNAKGLMGPGGLDPRIEKMLLKGEGRAFHMYSDDDELYYDGRIIVAEDLENMSTDALSETYFGPLEDFGTPNAGCTYIKYKKSGKEGKWKVL